jgi:guanosine-3',5'-bis(diphosphate) 3'-pyrophosphohydrolase
MRVIKQLVRKLDYLSKDQVDEIYHAYHLANDAHVGQKRYSGEAYINHPIAVATVLAEMRMDKESIMAGLLHDVVEDTTVTKADIAEQFGDTVADLVEGVTKLTKIEFKSRTEAQAENFSKMVLAMAKDIRVIIVKLADRLHNMRTIDSLPPPKRRRIAQETLEIYAPIANRLGMHSMYLELEDLGFKARYPRRFRVLQKAVDKATGNRREIFDVIFKSLKQGLNNSMCDKYEVKGREKHLYSIYKKMIKKRLAFEEIMDVYGFRIIVAGVDMCYRVLGVAHGLYKPVPGRFKDYISLPKANGYQSIHTTLVGPYGVPIEVQIRTYEMDEQANNGIAAHWLYKTGALQSGVTELKEQQWLKNLLDMQQRTGSSEEFIENAKVDLFPDEVYVFTPNGTIIQLPAGATPVDFAYAIHTDIGNYCVAAKIDRQLAPLSKRLSNGQTVEIVTSRSARPNPNWLDFVVTGKARSSLRNYLKIQKRTESISLGKRLLDKALSNFSLSVKKIPAEKFDALLTEAALGTRDDLFAELGLGNRVPMLVAHRLADTLQVLSASEILPEKLAMPLMVHGTEGLVIQIADCCYPLPGDPIVGIVNTGQGVVVHSEFCQHIAKLRLDPEVCMPLRWEPGIKGEFTTIVEVDVINNRGVLGEMALAVSEAGGNIHDIHVYERDDHRYMVSFTLIVEDRAHLAKIIRNIRKLKSVIHIRRA